MARRTSQSRSSRRSSGRPSLWLILGLTCLLVLLFLYETGRLDQWLGTESAPAPESAPASGDIRVFFTTPSLVYPDRANQRGVSPLLAAVIADIDAAQNNVELATFDFDIPEVTNALVRAKGRGAAVRVIVDSENLATPEVSQETGRLTDADIPVHFDDREPFMHNKFLVVDETVAWTGSWNVTTNDTFRNNNNFVRFTSRELATNYRHEFEQMFGGVFGTKKVSGTPYPSVAVGTARIETYFSPEDGVAQHVIDSINGAQQSVRFMTFSFTSKDIASAIIAKQKANLPVHGVFETQNASGTGAAFAALRRGGVDVLEDGNCYILHHKTIIIDEKIVITGSYNFTGSAENSNDENLVIINDPDVARQYVTEFDRVYAQAQQPARCN